MKVSENPYAAPADTSVVTPERTDFKDIPTPKLKQLRNDSHSIRTMCVLLSIGLIVNGMVLAALMRAAVRAGDATSGWNLVLIAVLAFVHLVVLIGLIRRPRWARIVAWIAFAPMLIAFPIGTLIAALMLVALSRSKELFGPEKLDHKSLDAEWKYRKKHKVP